MSGIGIFSGLWGGISNSIGDTFGAVTHLSDVKSGETEKNRQASLELARIKQQQQQKLLLYATIIIIVVVVAVVLMRKRNAVQPT
jgi:ABC-type molybdate transport system permease subunit